MPNPEDIELGNTEGDPPEEETEDSNTAGTPQPSESGDPPPVEVPLLALPEDTNLPAVAEPGAGTPPLRSTRQACGRAVRSVMRCMCLAVIIVFFEESMQLAANQLNKPNDRTGGLLGVLCSDSTTQNSTTTSNEALQAGCAILVLCLLFFYMFFAVALLITFFSGGFGHSCVNRIAPPHHSRRWMWVPPLYWEELPPPPDSPGQRAYWEEPPTGSSPPYPGDVQSHWGDPPPYSEEPSSGSSPPESSTQAEDSEGGITSHPNPDGDPPPSTSLRLLLESATHHALSENHEYEETRL